MLSEQFYSDAERAIAELYGSLEDDIIRDVARRIIKNDSVTDTAVWQSAKLQEAGLVYDDVIAEIAKVSGKSEKEIKKLFREASVEALAYDDQIYQLAGIQTTALKQSPALLKVLEAGFIKTSGLLHNLTLTTANMTQAAYINACDTAYMQIVSGAFSPQTAIKNAIVQASKTGAFVLYPTGHRDRLDVAIRRATLTGLTQTTQQLQWQRMDELEVDLVEVSAHAGARPSHAAWQGRIYSRSGRSDKYPDFVSSTGYGTGAGLGGWNCRHSFYPYFDGISQSAYSEQDLLNYQQMNSFEYDGKSYTQYEGTQQQRVYERTIRSTKRELVGLAEALKHAETDNLKAELQSEFEKKSVKLKGQEAKLKDFLAASKQRNERDRQQIIGFNRSVSSKAVWANKQYTKPVRSVIIKAQRFSDRYEADKLLRPETERLWGRLTDGEKEATFQYTVGSGPFNRPLRGYNKNWFSFVGIGKVPLNNEGAGEYIKELQSAIKKSKLKQDMWLFRGSDEQSLAGLLKVETGKITPENVTKLNRKFSGALVNDSGFFSTGVSEDASFVDNISYEILARKGTKGIYAEPFSHYGGTNSTGTWDGVEKGSYVGKEAEIILQAGYSFKILEIKLVDQKIKVIMEVLE